MVFIKFSSWFWPIPISYLHLPGNPEKAASFPKKILSEQEATPNSILPDYFYNQTTLFMKEIPLERYHVLTVFSSLFPENCGFGE
jgi:hypothetical protein